MAWVTPKTDWVAGDGIANADLNRIEGNITDLEYRVDNRVIMSGNVGWGHPSLSSLFRSPQQIIRVTVPGGHRLVLERVCFSFDSAGMRLRIDEDGDEKWTSSGFKGDSAPGVVLFTNATEGDLAAHPGVTLYNPTEGAVAAIPYDGWTVRLIVEPTP